MTKDEPGTRLFLAEAAYAESIVQSALGDLDACIAPSPDRGARVVHRQASSARGDTPSSPRPSTVR